MATDTIQVAIQSLQALNYKGISSAYLTLPSSRFFSVMNSTSDLASGCSGNACRLAALDAISNPSLAHSSNTPLPHHITYITSTQYSALPLCVSQTTNHPILLTIQTLSSMKSGKGGMYYRDDPTKLQSDSREPIEGSGAFYPVIRTFAITLAALPGSKSCVFQQGSLGVSTLCICISHRYSCGTTGLVGTVQLPDLTSARCGPHHDYSTYYYTYWQHIS